MANRTPVHATAMKTCVFLHLLVFLAESAKEGSLYMWIDSNQARTLIGFEEDILIVSEGKMAPFTHDFRKAQQRMPAIPVNIQHMNFTWQATGQAEYFYEFQALRSLDKDVMGDPTVNVPLLGMVSQKPSALCAPRCLNGGLCVSPGMCICPPGYYGINCDKANCTTVCHNGGTCFHPGKCICPAGFEGPHCEIGRDLDWPSGACKRLQEGGGSPVRSASFTGMGQQRPDGRTERGWKRAAPINIDTQSGEKKRQTPSDKDREEPVIVSLKSLNSDVVTNVTFVNKTRRKARAWWLDFRGDPVSYGDIGPDDRLRMTTYLTHPWIFRDTDTGAKLLVNMREIYFPEPNNDEDGCLVSHDVIITTPVYLLQDCCLMLIRKLVKQKDYRKLEIPESLRKDLSIAPSLEKELQQYNK
ncbi:UNVERIFIED_CONTAM: hypothetical protein FKN15_005902 [Acipenser sinensis]